MMADGNCSRKKRGCPICSGLSLGEMKPFCSRRCADIDLAKWFGARYFIPSNHPVGARDLDNSAEKCCDSD